MTRNVLALALACALASAPVLAQQPQPAPVPEAPDLVVLDGNPLENIRHTAETAT